MWARIASVVRSFGNLLLDPFRATAKLSFQRRVASALVFVCFSVVVMGGKGCEGCGDDQTMAGTQRLLYLLGIPYSTYSSARLHPAAQVIGSDGSQTGVASFLGNLTAITQPSGSYFLMNRSQDCSLNLMTATSPLNGTAAVSNVTTNYERTLHQLAGLKTTADVYPLGCGAPPGGLSSRPGLLLARKANAPFVLALAASNATGNAVYILAPSADLSTATFKAALSLPSASAVNGADLNADGNGDLIVVNGYAASSSFISVAPGNGDGTFQTVVSYPTGGKNSVAATSDDVNGDGKADVISVSNDQTVSVLLGNGDGTLKAAQNFAAPLPGGTTSGATPIVNLITADVNGDGKKDILCSNGLVLLGKGDGTFTAVATPAFPYVTASTTEGPNLAAGDVNKDGKMDVVTNDGSTISIALGNGDGTFKRGAAYSSIANTGFVTVTDLDGDGNLDIYSGLANSGFFTGDDSANAAGYALMGNGDGTFVGAPAASGAFNGSNLADVNGDGYPDLLVQTSGMVNGQTAVFNVLNGSATGIFAAASTITAPATVTFTVPQFTSPVTESTSNLPPSSFAIGDVNSDGKPDVAWVANYRQYAVYFVALNKGDGTFATATATGFPQIAPVSGFDINTIIGSLRIGDFNHDGKSDLLFNFNDTAGPFGSGLYLQGLGVLPGNGAGSFGNPILSYTYNTQTVPGNGGIPTVSSISDINGDGMPDVVASNSSFAVVSGSGVTTSSAQVYLGKTDGTFATPLTALSTTNLGSLAVADFNKDGKLDIAAFTETSSSQAQLTIALGNGNGSFGTPTMLSLLGGDAIRSAGIGAADFDGDGKVDIALIDSNDYSGVFYGRGNGTFSSVPLNNNIIPKDLISTAPALGSIATAADLNKDGKPDLLVGGTALLNIYGSAPVVVTAISTATTVAAPSNSVTLGASVTFTATVMPASGSAAPTGTVTFLDGSTTLGTGTLSSNKATYTTSSLGAGAHSITAVYGGDANYSGSTSSVFSVTVAAPIIGTTTMLTPSATTAISGASLSFTAQVTQASGSVIPSGNVVFSEGATSLGTVALDASGKAVLSLSTLSVGMHTISAMYGGSGSFASSTSSSVTVTITAAAMPDFAITVSPTSSSVARGSSVATTVSVTPANGFSQTVSLACSGAPAGYSCIVSAPSVTPSGSAASTATVTLRTTTSAMLRGQSRPLMFAGMWCFGFFGAATLGVLGFTRPRRWPGLLGVVCVSVALFAASGCGHSSQSVFSPTTVTLTVSGTSGSLSHAGTWAVSVQ